VLVKHLRKTLLHPGTNAVIQRWKGRYVKVGERATRLQEETVKGIWKGCRCKKRVPVQAQVEMLVIRSEAQ
jgi:hypothetical protein